MIEFFTKAEEEAKKAAELQKYLAELQKHQAEIRMADYDRSSKAMRDLIKEFGSVENAPLDRFLAARTPEK